MASRASLALSPEQRKAAELMATRDINEMTIEQIAEVVNVSERSIYRWKKEQDFITYQNELAEDLMQEFITEAYSELRKIVRTSEAGLKLKALELVLKNRGKLKQEQDVKVEVAAKTNEEINAEIAEMMARIKM